MTARILLVDDDVDLAELLRTAQHVPIQALRHE